MNLENIFKNVIKIDFLLYIVTLIFMFFTETEVSYVDPEAAWTIMDTLGILVLIYLIVYGVNLYFLYKFKPLGKTLYLPLMIFYIFLGILTLNEQYTISTFELLLDWIGGLLSGLIIALLYFTDIKDKFIKK